MATATPKPKRRAVSKARLYKEIESALEAHNVGADVSVSVLLDKIKDDIVTEALKN